MAKYTALTSQKNIPTLEGAKPTLSNASFYLQNTVYMSTTPHAAGGALLTVNDVVPLIDLPVGVMPVRAWRRVLTANDGAAAATIDVGVYKSSDDSAVDADGLIAAADAKAAAGVTTLGAGAMLATVGFKPAAEASFIGASMAVAATAASVVPRIQVIVECVAV